jgi:serine/threonine protein kinase
MVLVMEIAAGGELYDFLSDRKCLEELDARRVFRQIATAVYYCHKNNICHRDLKLENILLDENGNAKVHTVWSFNDVGAKDLPETWFSGFPAKKEQINGTCSVLSLFEGLEIPLI